MIDPVAFSVEHKHEQVVSYFDDETGLRAFIALHNTQRGPAVGGARRPTVVAPDPQKQNHYETSPFPRVRRHGTHFTGGV